MNHRRRSPTSIEWTQVPCAGFWCRVTLTLHPFEAAWAWRAHFANTDGTLVPGMFISVRMGGNVLPNALLVPDEAIGNDQSKRFVYVVGASNKAEYREIRLGATMDGQRVVTAGLKPGDQVILDGLQKLSPGAAVAPQGVQTARN